MKNPLNYSKILIILVEGIFTIGVELLTGYRGNRNFKLVDQSILNSGNNDFRDMYKSSDDCDDLFDAISLEKRKNYSGKIIDVASLYREINILRENQQKLVTLVEKISKDLSEERHFREKLYFELQSSTSRRGSDSISPSYPDNSSDKKVKDLKKKLIMAQLKLLNIDERNINNSKK